MSFLDSSGNGLNGALGRVLLCNIGRVGDTILRNTLIDSARRTFGEVDYLCGNPNREIVQADPRLARVFHHRNSLRGFHQTLKATWFTAHDCLIDLKDHPSSTSLAVAVVSRARVKVGFNRPSFRPFHRDTGTVHVRRRHKVEVMKDIARVAGLEPGDFNMSVPMDEESVRWFEQSHDNAGPFYFLNISATAPERMWPVDHWIRFFRECPHHDWPVLVNAVPAHRRMAQQIAAGVSRAVVFMPRKLMDVIAAMKASRAVLSVNTGLVHVASALDKPQVALNNGRNQVAEYGPRSTRQVVIEAEGQQSLRQIDPAHAIQLTNGSGLLLNV